MCALYTMQMNEITINDSVRCFQGNIISQEKTYKNAQFYGPDEKQTNNNKERMQQDNDGDVN